MTKKQKIFNVIIMSLMIGTIVYLSLSLNKKKDYMIGYISIEGCDHLTAEQYKQYADLVDKSSYAKLTLQVIKDRIEKHPYVAGADVRYDGGGKVTVRIAEKTFESILVKNDKQYILTDKLQVLPFITQTKRVDYPIISNAEIYDSIKVLKSLKGNYDIVTASKILTGIKLLNQELYDALSSIDMRNGEDIVLLFSFNDYPVVVGRGNEITKMVYFNDLWTYLKGKKINNYMNYVDLRYSGHVYFGIANDSLQTGTNGYPSLGEKS